MDFIVIDTDGKPHNFLGFPSEQSVLDEIARNVRKTYTVADINEIDRADFVDVDKVPNISDNKFIGWRGRNQAEIDAIQAGAEEKARATKIELQKTIMAGQALGLDVSKESAELSKI